MEKIHSSSSFFTLLRIAFYDMVKDRPGPIEITENEDDVLYRKKRAIDYSSGPAELRVLNLVF